MLLPRRLQGSQVTPQTSVGICPTTVLQWFCSSDESFSPAKNNKNRLAIITKPGKGINWLSKRQMSRPRVLQGSQLALKTSVGCLPAPLLQCSKQEAKLNNQQNQPRSASSSNKLNGLGRRLMTIPRGLQRCQLTPQTSDGIFLEAILQLAMHFADVKCCFQEARVRSLQALAVRQCSK